MFVDVTVIKIQMVVLVTFAFCQLTRPLVKRTDVSEASDWDGFAIEVEVRRYLLGFMSDIRASVLAAPLTVRLLCSFRIQGSEVLCCYNTLNGLSELVFSWDLNRCDFLFVPSHITIGIISSFFSTPRRSGETATN